MSRRARCVQDIPRPSGELRVARIDEGVDLPVIMQRLVDGAHPFEEKLVLLMPFLPVAPQRLEILKIVIARVDVDQLAWHGDGVYLFIDLLEYIV